jgi:hypothetical protein
MPIMEGNKQPLLKIKNFKKIKLTDAFPTFSEVLTRLFKKKITI